MIRRNIRVSIFVIFCIFSFFAANANEYTKQLKIYEKDSVYIARLSQDSKYGTEGMYILLNTSGKEILPRAYEKIFRFRGDIFYLQEADKLGLCDMKGQMIVDVEYSHISYLIDSFYRIGIDNKWGIFDFNKRQITIPPTYTSISYTKGEITPFHVILEKRDNAKYRMALTSSVINGKKEIALLDLKTSKEFIPSGKYNDISYSDECEFMRVSKDSGWEILDYKGKVYLTSKEYYDADITPYGFITTDSTSLKGFVSLQGSVIKPSFHKIYFANNGVAITEDKANKYGAIHSSGKEITPPVFDYIYVQKTYLSVVKKGKFGIMDFEGKQIFPCKYKNIEYYPEDGLAVVDNNDKQALITTKGKTLIPLKYENVYYDSGMARIVTEDNKWGLYNVAKKLLVKPKYDEIKKFVNGVAVIGNYSESGNEYGLIDENGKEIVKLSYSTMFFDETQKYATVSLGKKHGMIGARGEILVPVIFNRFREYKAESDEQGIVIVELGDKYGAYNFHKAKELLAPIYDNVLNFSYSQGIRYSLHGKYGFADINGKTIIEPQYSSLGALFGGYFKVGLNGKYGVINMKDEIIIPCEYNSILGAFNTNYIIAKKGNKTGVLDLDNKILVDFDFDDIKYNSKLNIFEGQKGEEKGIVIEPRQYVIIKK